MVVDPDRPRMRRAFLIPLGFAAFDAATVVLVRHPAPGAVADGLAQPLAVVTAWGTLGAALWLALAAGIGIAWSGYAAVLRELAGPAATEAYSQMFAPAQIAARIAGICGLTLAIAWLAPVTFSSDLYAYAAYGRMEALGLDPYAMPHLPSGDPLLRAAIFQWANPLPACVYGPLFVALGNLAVRIGTPWGPVVELSLLRALAAAALVACAVAAYALFARRSPREGLLAAAVVALNPVALWSAAEGHNDGIALAFALGGLALVQRATERRLVPLLAGYACIAAGALVKAPAVLALAIAPTLVVPPLRRAAWWISAAALAGSVVASLPMVPLLHVAATRGGVVPQGSVPALFAALFRRLAVADAAHLAMLASAAAAAVVAALGFMRVRRRLQDGWALACCAPWIALPNPYAWYAVWTLPVVAIAPRSIAARTLLACGAAAVVRYLPDAAGRLPAHAVALATTAALLMPAIVIIAGAARDRATLSGQPVPDASPP